MEMRAQCVHCLLRRVQFETDLVAPEKETVIMEKCLNVLSEEFKAGVNSAETATKVHRVAYDMLGEDPYKTLKEHSTKLARRLFPRAREFVENSDDRFKAAVICSIVGNVMDFGINVKIDDPDYLEREFDNLIEEGLAVDDTPDIKDLLANAEQVAYLTDNCGEVIFDRLLLEELKGSGIHTTLVVKGEAILTDATLDDARESGLTELVDNTITTERFAVGLPTRDMPSELENVLSESSLIIAKGMANFESLSDTEYLPIAYLMRTKCEPVAESLGAPYDANIACLVK